MSGWRVELRRTDGLLWRWVAYVYRDGYSHVSMVKMAATQSGAMRRARRWIATKDEPSKNFIVR